MDDGCYWVTSWQEERLKRKDFTDMLNDDAMHHALLAICFEIVVHVYLRLSKPFPAVAQALGVCEFELLVMIENFLRDFESALSREVTFDAPPNPDLTIGLSLHARACIIKTIAIVTAIARAFEQSAHVHRLVHMTRAHQEVQAAHVHTMEADHVHPRLAGEAPRDPAPQQDCRLQRVEDGLAPHQPSG